MKKVLVILFVVSQFITSCSIKGNFKGLYSYYESEKKVSPNLFKKNVQICTLKYNQYVYIINGINLKNCIASEEKSLIYIWEPHCKSKFCLPLGTIQEICKEKGIKLYIVAQYYDSELMSKKYNLDSPIFGIDTEYYNTNLVEKYVTKFIHDFNINKEIGERYLYFENGNFVKSYDDIYTNDVL